MPEGQTLATEIYPSLAISPDGTQRVLRLESASSWQLFSQRIDQFEPTPIPGSEKGHSPFFSPDGQWIGFLANSRIYRVPASGGRALFVSNAPSLSPGSPGATWGPDNTIVFAAGVSGLMRVSIGPGAAPERLTTPDAARGEVMHVEPQFLPNGRDVLFSIRTSDDQWRVAILSLDTGDWEWLDAIGDVAGARYVSAGHLIYAQSGVLFAIPLDVERRTFTGPPVALPGSVYTRVVADAVIAQFAVSDAGLMLYASGGPPDWTLVSVSESNGPSPLGASPPRLYRYPRVSPDGDRVAVTIEEDRSDIYVVDSRSGASRNLTKSVGNSTQPVWDPEGERLAFASRRVGSDAYDVFLMPIDGSAEADVLIGRTGGQFPTSWVKGLLAFYELDNVTARDIFTWSIEDQEAAEVVATPWNERGAVLSPDASLLAYVSNESGSDQVYVRQYPGGAQEVVSTEAGTEPVWHPSGQELFFWSGNTLMAARIQAVPRLEVVSRRKVLEGSYIRTATGPANYDVTPDGRSFVMVLDPEGAAAQLRVVENWAGGLDSPAAD